MTHSESGTVTNTANQTVPAYTQGLTYNTFGNITHRSTGVWGSTDSFSAVYTNDRKTGGSEIFDANGNILDNTGSASNYDHWTFDASGRLIQQASREYHASPTQTDQLHSITEGLDGDALAVKRAEDRSFTIFGNTTTNNETLYYVRSSVLGGAVVTEIDDQGNKKKTHVFLGSGEIAEQIVGTASAVIWQHSDPVTNSHNSINADGTIYDDGSASSEFNAELEPMGGAIPDNDPAAETAGMPPTYKGGGSVVSNPEYNCVFDGMLMDDMKLCKQALGNGSGYIDGDNTSPGALGDLGISPVWSWRNTTRAHRHDDPNMVYIDTDIESYISGYNVWGTGAEVTRDLDSCPWCHDGAGHTNEHAQGGSGISQECKSALAAINKNETILNRALQNRSWFVFQGQHFDPQVLAAIAIRESEVDPNRVEAGGNGRGLMQIDIGQHPEYANDPQLFDPNWSVKTADSIMAGEFANLEERYGYQGYSLMLMGLHVHNGGYFKTRDRRGKPIVDQAKMRQLSTSQNPKDFDSGTTGNNYVTSILNIAKNCFPTQWN